MRLSYPPVVQILFATVSCPVSRKEFHQREIRCVRYQPLKDKTSWGLDLGVRASHSYIFRHLLIIPGLFYRFDKRCKDRTPNSPGGLSWSVGNYAPFWTVRYFYASIIECTVPRRGRLYNDSSL